jgi:hypothetical protein
MKLKLIPIAIILMLLLFVMATSISAYAGGKPADEKPTDMLAGIRDRLNKLIQDVNAFLESQNKIFKVEVIDKPPYPEPISDPKPISPFPPPPVLFEPQRGGLQLINDSLDNLREIVPIDINESNETIIKLITEVSGAQVENAMNAFNSAQKRYQDYSHLLSKAQKSEIENELLNAWKAIKLVEAAYMPINSIEPPQNIEDLSYINTPEFCYLLSIYEDQYELPRGLLWSVMIQESSGYNYGYHIPLTKKFGTEGRWIINAKTGEWDWSTAFGPFGITNRTARDPGHSVDPYDTSDRSLQPQIRFAASYLSALINKYGLKKGIGSYGEGERYADSVINRMYNYPGHVIELPF